MTEAYKYLGIQQADSIKNEQMKDTRKEYKKTSSINSKVKT